MAMFEITTTAQVERTYSVEADDEAQAKKRLRIYIADPDSVKPGVVTPAEEKNTTSERINNVDEGSKDVGQVSQDGS